jgi:hypothetical protein
MKNSTMRNKIQKNFTSKDKPLKEKEKEKDNLTPTYFIGFLKLVSLILSMDLRDVQLFYRVI